MPTPNIRKKRETIGPDLRLGSNVANPEQSPNIGYTRQEVSNLASKWELVEDCLEGEDAMKAREDKYLPRPNSKDVTAENLARYDSYLARAVFYNVVGRTLEGLVGQVFSRDPITTIPDELKSMVDNVDGEMVSLDQQAKQGLMRSISYGGFGLLVDYPVTSGAISLAEQKAGTIRPTITQYTRKSIINWRWKKRGGVKVLSLVVISEQGVASDDGFEEVCEAQWRVLELINDVYSITVWRYDEKAKNYVVKEATVRPTDGKGLPLDEIPFYFCGVLNNNAAPDKPALYDLAVLNRAHYRNSADYEDSCYLVGQPTPVFAGLTKQWVQDVFKNKPIQLGSRGSVALPVGGTASLMQANPNSMPKEAMDQKELQMAALGAKLIESGGGQNTLGQAQLDESTESSMLATSAKNVSLVYTLAMKMAARLHNVDPKDISYSLNTDFPASRLTPNERTETVLEWQAGAISLTEMRAAMRKAGVATQDLAEFKADIVANPPPVPAEMKNNGGEGGSDNEPKKNKDSENNGGNQNKT